jgi:hypothetical protein
MKPSVEDMLEAVQSALRDTVAPVVSDQFAASALRSVDAILNHLRARAPVESQVLAMDNRDLYEVFSIETQTLSMLEPRISLATDLDAFLAKACEQSGANVLVADLETLNLEGRGLVDELLVLCHSKPTNPEAIHMHANLRGYINRHLERESPFFFPVYTGRPL